MIDSLLGVFTNLEESYGLLLSALFLYSISVSIAFGWLLKKYVNASDKQTEAVLLTTQTLSKNNKLFKEMKTTLKDEFNDTKTQLEVIKGFFLIGGHPGPKGGDENG